MAATPSRGPRRDEMKHKNFWGLSTLYYIVIGVMVAQTVISAFFDMRIFVILLVFTLAVIGFAVYRLANMQRYMRSLLSGISSSLDSSGSEVLEGFSIPVIVAAENNEILWYNEAFRSILLDGEDIFGHDLSEIVGEEIWELLAGNKQTSVSYNGRIFSVYQSISHISGVTQRVYYFVDETKLRRTAEEYALSRPAVALIAIDNLDEVAQGGRDSEKAAISSDVEIEIENWAAPTDGIVRKLTGERFMIILEERHLQSLMEQRFAILDRVRNMSLNSKKHATLSIGVGRGGASLRECEEMDGQALDMALGRGGDQAAVKDKNNDYQFFGGVSKAVEKRTRVRTRVVASALRELIEGSDNVVVMGHRFADLDCFGAAFAMWSAARSLGKEAVVVMDREQSMALTLLDRIEAAGITDCVCSGKDILPHIGRKTLLIVVDTHRAGFVDSPEVYKACKTVVVIDHHRKAVDFIDNAVVFYHETFASSACEMVSELLQYMNEKAVGRLEAEALLAGIMLDTRNYVLHTGVRTFEASAFLRNRGADPVEVKRLFAENMEVYQQKAAVVADVRVFEDCAVAVNRVEDGFTRIASAQAADELLNIEGVNGSFVLFRNKDEIDISARSLGLMNVQLIMERLGGGGHQTMSACQLKGVDFDGALEKLMEAINDYRMGEGRSPLPADKNMTVQP